MKRPLGRVPAFTSGGMDGGGVAEPRGGVFGLQVTAGRWQVSKVFGCICEDVTDGVKRDHASLSAPPPHILFIYYLIFWGRGGGGVPAHVTGYCGTFRCCRPWRLRPAQDGAVKEKAWMPHEDVKREDSGFNASFAQDSACSAELIIQPESSAWLPGVTLKLESLSFFSFFNHRSSSRRIETLFRTLKLYLLAITPLPPHSHAPSVTCV